MHPATIYHLTEQRDAFQRRAEAAEREAAELAERLREARDEAADDRMRLDWLRDNAAACVLWRWVDDPRDAIDAAMAAQQTTDTLTTSPRI